MLAVLLATAFAAQQRVAVIGGGFAGTSTTYYLKQLCGDCYNMTIYEGWDHLGGRVWHQDWPNSSLVVNAGGDAWSNTNTYLMQLMKELPIEEDTYPSRPYNTTGLYKGPGNGWAPMAVSEKVDPKFFESAAAIEEQVALVQAALIANYDERGLNVSTGRPYESVEEFARFGGLDSFSKITTQERLKAVDGIMMNQLVIPSCRDIYDQSITLNGFAGMAVALSALTPEHSSKGGNDQVVIKLAQKSGALVYLNSAVSTVTLANDNLFYLTVNGTQMGPYDRVVLASPIEAAGVWNGGQIIPIKWEGFTPPPMKMREYNHWYVIWLEAKAAKPSAFGLPDSQPVPDFTLTMENSTARFVKLAAEYTLENGNIAFRFFSNYPIDDLDQRFEGLVWNKTFHWPHTFPDLTPTTEYQPIKLHDRVYYPNALESMAVAMEVGVIGGRNAAMQIHREKDN